MYLLCFSNCLFHDTTISSKIGFKNLVVCAIRISAFHTCIEFVFEFDGFEYADSDPREYFYVCVYLV